MMQHILDSHLAVARIHLVARLLKGRVVIIQETSSPLGSLMKNLLLRTVTLVILSLFAISCGQNAPSNVLTGVKVEAKTINDDVWMSFAADLNLGAMQFASLSIPVLHPRGQTPVGQLELVSGLGGVNQLKISVNVSELADIQTTSATLPNGNMIPLIANNQVIALNIGNGARVYLALSETVTAIGVAVPIAAFDSIGRTLPGLNFFPIINSNNVVGTAGIFTGLNPGQNGIAVVADVSKVVNLGNLLQSSAPAIMAIQAQEAESTLKLDYRSHSGSKSQKAQLDQMIYDLNQKRTILRMR